MPADAETIEVVEAAPAEVTETIEVAAVEETAAPAAEAASEPAPEAPAAKPEPVVHERDLTPEELIVAMEASFRDFNDGDIVEGEVVKIDRDEVLLDIGYKSEGVIPSKELSIRHDVDPNEVVKVGERTGGPGPAEGGQGGPADPVQEARPVRARLGQDRGGHELRARRSRARSSRSSRAA